MDKQSLPVRIIAAGLPIVVIALVFGAIGYATTQPEAAPISPLAAGNPGEQSARGEITAASASTITIVSEDGRSNEYALAGDISVEVLEPITLAAIQVGDWLNGGAIRHPDTLLALVSLILLPNPVTP